MKVETVKCDVCGVLKRETNHWFQLVVDKAEPLHQSVLLGRTLNIEGSGFDALLDLCSQKCVQTVVQRWMDGQPLTGPSQAQHFEMSKEAVILDPGLPCKEDMLIVENWDARDYGADL